MSARMIDVRMCDDPEGHDWKACPHTLTYRRTLGSTHVLGPDVVALGTPRILQVLRQEMAISCASDSKGVQHMIPAACTFVVHIEREAGALKGGSIREDGIDDVAVIPGDGDRYIVVLSSPDAELDDLLANSPEWSLRRTQERLALLKAA